MQKCTATVRLGGDLENCVVKEGVTPGEILVLQAIHGNDAVVDIIPTEFDETVRQEAEFDRLAQAYGGGNWTSAPGEENPNIVHRLFPGALKRLPTTLTEIGLQNLEPVTEEPPVRQRAPRKPKAEAPAPEVAPEELAPSLTADDAGDAEAAGDNAAAD